MKELIDSKDLERDRCSYDLPGQESCKWIDETFEAREIIKALKAQKEWLCRHLAGIGKVILKDIAKHHSPLRCPSEHEWCPEHYDCTQCWSDASEKAIFTSEA